MGGGTATAMLVGLVGLMGCAPVPPRVAYEPGGEANGAVFFVEARADHDRHYLIMCLPERIPPCARVAPVTAGSASSLRAWAATAAADEEPVRERVVVRAPIGLPPGEEPDAEAQAAGVGSGTVRIVTPGAWANVYAERGRFLGQTPLQVRLPAGRHVLTFRPYGQPVDAPPSVTVDVTAGESTAVVLRDFAEE